MSVQSDPSRRMSRPMTPGIGVVSRAPEPLADHEHICALRLVFGRERAAGDWFDTKRVEYSGGDPLPRHGFGVTVGAGHYHSADSRSEASNLLERATAGIPIEHVERRHVAPRAGRAVLPNRDQPPGVAEGKGSKEGRIDESENRTVRANAQRQCQSGNQRESRGVLQLPNRILEIVQQLVEPQDRTRGCSHVGLRRRTGTIRWRDPAFRHASVAKCNRPA